MGGSGQRMGGSGQRVKKWAKSAFCGKGVISLGKENLMMSPPPSSFPHFPLSNLQYMLQNLVGIMQISTIISSQSRSGMGK